MGENKKSRKVQVIPNDLSSGMIARVTDLTELKDIAEAIRKSEERFRSFFEKARDPILLIDDSFHFIDCNIAAVKILGAGSRDEILDKPPAYFSPDYQPDGQLSVIKAEQMIKIAYKKGSLQFEWIHKRMDGVAMYMDVSLTVITLGSKKVLLVHWRDITGSKKAGETIRKLYQAIEQTSEIVFTTRMPVGRPASRQPERGFGCTRPSRSSDREAATLPFDQNARRDRGRNRRETAYSPPQSRSERSRWPRLRRGTNSGPDREERRRSHGRTRRPSD